MDGGADIGGEAQAWAELSARIAAVAPRLETANAVSEAAGHLSPDAVAALREAGLLSIKSPRAAGGREMSWTLQIQALEQVAYHCVAAGWCLMLYIDNAGKALASLEDAAMRRVLADGRFPAVCGGGGLRIGELAEAAGGYRLTGRWIYGSGIAPADYALVRAKLPAQGERPPQVRQCLVPVADLAVVDNWQVMGLKGTGSADYEARDVFVPADMTFDAAAPALRGGALYRLGTFGYAGLCMPPVMLGAARRALDDLAAASVTHERGYVVRTKLGERQAFQAFLGRADLQLKAARALAIQMGERLLADAEVLGESPEANEAETRAVGVHCADVAIAVMGEIVRYAGGAGVRAGHRFERTLRDLHMAGTHMFVSDIAYENHAHFLMGLPDARLSA